MDDVLAWAERVLGGCTLIRDCTWQHRMSRVLRLRDRTGADWFLKQHRDQDRYDAELTAYRRWVPALGGRAPNLRSCEDELRAIILSAVPGTLAPWPSQAAPAVPGRLHGSEVAIHRQAGEVLRRLHEAQEPLPWPDLGAAKADELDRLAARAAGLFTAGELSFARSQVRALGSVTAAVMVPCHRDYTPRNWLVHDGALSVIDFEWVRLDAPVSDMARLYLNVWPGRPDLAEAFLAGYGRPRPLDADDRAILNGCVAVTAIWLIIKARESAQPSFEDAVRAALHHLIGF